MRRRLEWTALCRLAMAAVVILLPGQAAAASFLVCRTFDMAAPLMSALTIPGHSVYRDNGRTDDPLGPFGNDRWQLRLETLGPVAIQPLDECARVLVRITSDSSVKAVASGDRRSFVYVGSSLLIDAPAESEELLSTRGLVLDQVP